MKTLQIIDKEKQQVQDKKVFLYKPYNINESRLKTPKLTFIQDKINKLEKYMKYMQASIKTILIYLLPHYKTIQPQEECDEQY